MLFQQITTTTRTQAGKRKRFLLRAAACFDCSVVYPTVLKMERERKCDDMNLKSIGI
jgi:hypothetical protein